MCSVMIDIVKLRMPGYLFSRLKNRITESVRRGCTVAEDDNKKRGDHLFGWSQFVGVKDKSL